MPQSMKNNLTGQTKISKKKLMAGSNNQSMVNKSKQSFDKNAIAQMSGGSQGKGSNMMGLTTHHNTFYGNIKQNHPQSRQQNNSLGSKGGTLSSQQSAAHPHQQSMLSKNDIIAKYVKSMNQNQTVGQNQIPTTQKQVRQGSGGFNTSQYNNYIKQAVGQNPNAILAQQN